MARSRILKPSFFNNEELASFGPCAQLLFEGLWTLADREGRLEDRPVRIQGQIFPFRFQEVDVDDLLNKLAGGPDPFIVRYQANQKRYIQIVHFDKHGHPHHQEPSSEIPRPKKFRSSSEQLPKSMRTNPSISYLSSPITVSSKKKNSSEPEKPSSEPPFIPVPDELVGLQLYEKDRRLCHQFPAAMGAWLKAYPGVNLREEIKRAHAWEVTNPERQKINRIRFLNTWFARVQDRGGSAHVNGYTGREGVSQYAAIARTARQSEGLRAVGEPTAGSVLERVRNLPPVRAKAGGGAGR